MRIALTVCVAMTMAVAAGSGCAYRAPVVPAFGMGVHATSQPMDVEFNATKIRRPSGEASCVSVLGLWSRGDASIRAAAEQGNIRLVYHADSRFVNVLGIYQKHTTVVYGPRREPEAAEE